MDIKPIHSDTTYQEALKEIESLFDALLGIEEGDRLEVLVALVEVYRA